MRKLRTIEMVRLSVEDYRKADKAPVVVVLDDVRSAYNVGSIFRTADAFRIEGIVLCGITAVPPSTEIHKTALGAEDAVPYEYYNDAIVCVQSLKAKGYHILAVEQAEGSTPLHTFTPLPNEHYAIIMGNEVKGVHQEVIDLCEGCLEIPQRGTKHSMNVAVTAGIVLYDFSRGKE